MWPLNGLVSYPMLGVLAVIVIMYYYFLFLGASIYIGIKEAIHNPYPTELKFTVSGVDMCTLPDTCSHQGRCINHMESYICVCNPGYEFNSITCVNNNECEKDDICANGDCKDTLGSYVCSCNLGYFPDRNSTSCKDVDECDIDTHICGLGKCVNTKGSYDCTCEEGYEKKSENNFCTDIDECITKCNGVGMKECTNLPRTFQCTCNTGFLPTVDGSCSDVDECLTDNPCGGGGQCTNRPGDYRCNCGTGFEQYQEQSGSSAGKERCVDINECRNDATLCGDTGTCMNQLGSYYCQCNEGYRYQFLPTPSCFDIDECSKENTDCGHRGKCNNLPGSWECICGTNFIHAPTTADETRSTNQMPCIFNTDGYTKFDGIFYYLNPSKTSFSDARTICESKGVSMAFLENDKVLQFFKKKLNTANEPNVYLGIYYKDKNKYPITTYDGKYTKYLPWVNKPEDLNTKKCVVLYAMLNTKKEPIAVAQNEECNEVRKFFCMYIPKNYEPKISHFFAGDKEVCNWPEPYRPICKPYGQCVNVNNKFGYKCNCIKGFINQKRSAKATGYEGLPEQHTWPCAFAANSPNNKWIDNIAYIFPKQTANYNKAIQICEDYSPAMKIAYPMTEKALEYMKFAASRSCNKQIKSDGSGSYETCTKVSPQAFMGIKYESSSWKRTYDDKVISTTWWPTGTVPTLPNQCIIYKFDKQIVYSAQDCNQITYFFCMFVPKPNEDRSQGDESDRGEGDTGDTGETESAGKGNHIEAVNYENYEKSIEEFITDKGDSKLINNGGNVELSDSRVSNTEDLTENGGDKTDAKSSENRDGTGELGRDNGDNNKRNKIRSNTGGSVSSVNDTAESAVIGDGKDTRGDGNSSDDSKTSGNVGTESQ